jgi:hypothetical protein
MSTSVWTISATFTSSADAQAAIDLLAELGITAQIHHQSLQRKINPARTWRSGKILLEAMRKGRQTWYWEDITKVLEENGYVASSSGMLLGRLVEEGDLVRIERGRYRLADRGLIPLTVLSTPIDERAI